MIAMIVSRIRRGRLLLGLAVVAVAAIATPARAEHVTFNTNDSFFTAGAGASLGGTSQTIVFMDGGKTVNLAFNPLLVDLDVPPTSAPDYGSFQITTSGFASGESITIGAGSMFTLVLNQTTPTGGMLSFTGELSGTVGEDTGFLVLTYMTTTGSIGTIDYQLAVLAPNPQTPDNSIVFDPQVSGGLTRPTVFVSNAIPEPASMSMLAMGAVTLAGYAARRRKAVKA